MSAGDAAEHYDRTVKHAATPVWPARSPGLMERLATRTKAGRSPRFSHILRGHLAILTATTVLSLSLVVSGAGASSPTVAADLAFTRAAHSAPSPRAYLAQAEHYSSEIAARIGHTLLLSLSVVVNAKDIKVGGKDVLAYADAESGSGRARHRYPRRAA